MNESCTREVPLTVMLPGIIMLTDDAINETISEEDN